MRQPFGEAAGGLTPQHVEALNAVDLQVYTGMHGAFANLKGHGPATVGVTDLEYAGIEQIVDSLEPERGDVLALERQEWTVLTAEARAAAEIDYARQNSQYMGPRTYNLPHALKDGRAFRVIDPFVYGTLLANRKGIDTMYADMSYDDWLLHVARFPDLDLMARAKSPERHQAIARGLGEIAATMVPSDEKPVLAYAVGAAHEAPLKRLFSENDVTASFHKFGPDRSLERYVNDWRDVLSNLTGGVVRSSDTILAEQWVANAEAVQRQKRQ